MAAACSKIEQAGSLLDQVVDKTPTSQSMDYLDGLPIWTTLKLTMPVKFSD